MLDWIERFIAWLLRTKRDEHEFIRGERDDSRKDFAAVNVEYHKLMEQYGKLNQELQQRIDVLEDKYASLEASHEREKNEHKECQRRLRDLEHETDRLKAQVAVLIAKEKVRGQAEGGS
jgi:uncharacterized protein (DUF3084 family)